MLKINRMTDYAILVLGLLHQRRGEQMSAGDIAQYLQLNKTTIAKVIKALSAAEMVKTSRGINGGCHLAIDVSQISLAKVIEAIDGPIALTACVDGADEACEVSHGCFMSGHWNHVNGAIRSALEGVALVDLFDPERSFPERDVKMINTEIFAEQG